MFGNVGSSGLIYSPSLNLMLHCDDAGVVAGVGVKYVWVGMYVGAKVSLIVPLSSCDAVKRVIDDYKRTQ